MILDTKESGVKRITGKFQRVTLPRLLEGVLQLLLMLSYVTTTAAEATAAFVLDFTEAFWQMRIHPSERRYYCATAILRGRRRYLVFLRAAQGSAIAPLLWARLAALVMRLTQSLFEAHELALMCYVDDPLAALRGTWDEMRLNAAVMILVWEALGFRLAYAKGQIGPMVTWIGGTMRCEHNGIRVWVKESITKDILLDITEMLRGNVITHKVMQSVVSTLSSPSATCWAR